MKQYLKMVDVFADSAKKGTNLVCGKTLVAKFVDGVECEYSVHAINFHDELVAEVERLREVNEALMVALIDFVMIGDRDLCGLELIQPELEQAKAAIEKANGVKK